MTRRRKTLLAAAAASLLAVGGVAGYAVAADGSGQGTFTQGLSFPGPFSGASASTAGTATIAAGHESASVAVRLPAFTIPNAGGGQDTNHGIAVLEGHHPGLWVVGVRVSPGTSDYRRSDGTLTVWLNKPTTSPVTFTYWTFGLFND